ncbi:MAG: N-acetylglucosamine-6-phosphate deacetylase, partial [Planctomycetota bacterium]
MRLSIPGFVDLQVNGFRGVEFASERLTAEAFRATARALFERGTAAFLATVVTGPEAMYRHSLPVIARVLAEEEFQGRILGIHLEGPFISPRTGAVGAHPPEHVRAPDMAFFDRLMEWSLGSVRILTLAAEPEGAEALARHAAARGVVVSLGHELAEEAEQERLARAGARALTHLGNGIPNILPRHPNPIWSALANDALFMMVIGDGHHLPRSTLKAMIRAKGVERSAVVSDAFALAGMPPGEYDILNNHVILEPSGRLYNPEKNCLVGSSLTLLECMNFLASTGDFTLEEMLALGFYNPLRLIGVSPVELTAGTT